MIAPMDSKHTNHKLHKYLATALWERGVSTMFEVGQMNRLRVLEVLRRGLLLGEEGDEILLPASVAPENARVGERLDVFVYTDSDDRVVATTERPYAVVGDFALLEVIDVSPHGAFLDWGLGKDLLVPTKEQHQPLRRGDVVVVAVVLDFEGRVMGTSRLARHFDLDTRRLEPGQAVDALVYGFSDRGVRVVVDGRFSGLIFHDHTDRRLNIGDIAPAFILGIRPDGRIDLSMRAPGRTRNDDAEEILRALEHAGGFLPLHDRSPPGRIRDELNMSKKAFKRALGGLYRRRLIAIEPDGIRRSEPKD